MGKAVPGTELVYRAGCYVRICIDSRHSAIFRRKYVIYIGNITNQLIPSNPTTEKQRRIIRSIVKLPKRLIQGLTRTDNSRQTIHRYNRQGKRNINHSYDQQVYRGSGFHPISPAQSCNYFFRTYSACCKKWYEKLYNHSSCCMQSKHQYKRNQPQNAQETVVHTVQSAKDSIQPD